MAGSRRSRAAVSLVQTAQVAESTATATEAANGQSSAPSSAAGEEEQQQQPPLPLSQVFLSALWAQKQQLAVVSAALVIGKLCSFFS